MKNSNDLQQSIRSGSNEPTLLSANEYQLLQTFGQSDYGEYDEVHWMWDIQDLSGLSGKTFSGVCSSLTKKGILQSSTEGDKGMNQVKIRDTYTIWLTDKGKQVYKSFFKRSNIKPSRRR